MRKLILIAIVLMISYNGQAQNGVHFEQGSNWQQVLAKAKTENKYIFVDCYATWCEPCKMMDKDVYVKDTIGNIINGSFISVKVQCDTSKNDDAAIRSWYADAHRITTDHKIKALPTFLFFNPEGEIVHKGQGYLRPHDFAVLASQALNPSIQYFTLVKHFKEGTLDYAAMPLLARTAKGFRDEALTRDIVNKYEQDYLDKLPNQQFATKENFYFYSDYKNNLDSKGRIFDWYFHKQALVDSITHNPGYADRMVNYIIYKEEVDARFEVARKTAGTPDWKSIARSIDRKFGAKYVEGNALTGKVNWYRSVQNWKNYSKFLVTKLERDGIEHLPKNASNMLFLNNSAFEIFQHSQNPKELETAIRWSDLAMQMTKEPGGDLLDTKANLLYKLGKKEEALELEKKAAELAHHNRDVQDAYQKMLAGKPTW